MNNNDKIKKFFEKIRVDDKMDLIIFNSLKRTRTEKKIYKPILIGVITFLLSGFGVLAVIESYKVERKKINNRDEITITINDKVKISNKNLICDEKTTLRNVEDILEINLLDIPSYNKDTLSNCEIIKNENGNIKRVHLINDDNYYKANNNNEKSLYYDIQFMTNYADKLDEAYFKNKVLTSSSSSEILNEMYEKYYIKNLNIEAHIIKWQDYENSHQTYAFFIYENVAYILKGYNINKIELEEILNSINKGN